MKKSSTIFFKNPNRNINSIDPESLYASDRKTSREKLFH